jgi:hypothetical protein
VWLGCMVGLAEDSMLDVMLDLFDGTILDDMLGPILGITDGNIEFALLGSIGRAFDGSLEGEVLGMNVEGMVGSEVSKALGPWLGDWLGENEGGSDAKSLFWIVGSCDELLETKMLGAIEDAIVGMMLGWFDGTGIFVGEMFGVIDDSIIGALLDVETVWNVGRTLGNVDCTVFGSSLGVICMDAVGTPLCWIVGNDDVYLVTKLLGTSDGVIDGYALGVAIGSMLGFVDGNDEWSLVGDALGMVTGVSDCFFDGTSRGQSLGLVLGLVNGGNDNFAFGWLVGCWDGWTGAVCIGTLVGKVIEGTKIGSLLGCAVSATPKFDDGNLLGAELGSLLVCLINTVGWFVFEVFGCPIGFCCIGTGVGTVLEFLSSVGLVDGVSVEGNFVAVATVGNRVDCVFCGCLDGMVITTCSGLWDGDNVAATFGAVSGDCVSIGDGNLVGTVDMTNRGWRDGKNVTSMLGASTGACVVVDDEGKLVEGGNITGSEVPIVGRIGFWVGLDVGFWVLAFVGSSVEGNFVNGVSVFGCPLRRICGWWVGISSEGKIVASTSVGDWLIGIVCGVFVGTVVIVFCGFRNGDDVTATLGTFTGDCGGIDDEGTVVEGDSVGKSEISLVGCLVAEAFGVSVGIFIIGTFIGLWIGLAIGWAEVVVLGLPVRGASVGRRAPATVGTCVGFTCGFLVGWVVELLCGLRIGCGVSMMVGTALGDCVGITVGDGDTVGIVGRPVDLFDGACAGDSVIDFWTGTRTG